ncbi:recombinase family protein [Streptomyces sp. NPDC005091]
MHQQDLTGRRHPFSRGRRLPPTTPGPPSRLPVRRPAVPAPADRRTRQPRTTPVAPPVTHIRTIRPPFCDGTLPRPHQRDVAAHPLVVRLSVVETSAWSYRGRKRPRAGRWRAPTTTPGSRLAFHVFAALAEFIRNLIAQGAHEGLAAARARGKEASVGRPPCTPGAGSPQWGPGA